MQFREIENPLGGYIDPRDITWLRHGDSTVLPFVTVDCDECGRNLTGDYAFGEAYPSRINGDSRYGYELHHECNAKITKVLDRLARGGWVSRINNKLGQLVVLLRELGQDDRDINTLVEKISNEH